ncbi:IclR family transcriptional regulator [Sphingobium sp. BYY-5]|uniref:IclR family transcriptional regulator n=1 Tax=Sphingobium sp. BYY-5 TaxID=2926400 RepID=UPI001FA7C5B2|nr:IclR family transcriptional regulator [Sphingobium sp. BYY-5]MCI4591866.1 IclR family transcriptional regulator [Sphingobium sp. BYY-5]
MNGKTRYQAPALKKGLEILELLAGASDPLIMSDISTALGRSVSEIFRMLQVLEEHGYITRAEDGYRLTNRLFALGMSQPPIHDLASTALPVMQELARKAGQSCHLAVASGAEMVVIIAIEAPGLSGFAVRVGYRRPLHRSNSGRILLAFQPPEARAGMLDAIRATGDQWDEAELEARLKAAVAAGGAISPSPMLTGITDLSAPILIGGEARAALTMPFVDGAANRATVEKCDQLVRHAAATIGTAMSPIMAVPPRSKEEEQ